MKDHDFEISRYSSAELMRLADIERAKYLRAVFKRLFARWSGNRVAPDAVGLSGAKA